jgi:hypothetical protein
MSINIDQPSKRPPRGRPFKKGNSGRPTGSRNKTTIALEGILDGHATAIMNKLVEQALEGQPAALKLALERMVPVRTERLVTFHLPKIKSASDGAVALAAVNDAVASGDITPSEGLAISQMIGVTVRAFEAKEFESRILALETPVEEDDQ